MDAATQKKWDDAAKTYDFMSQSGPGRRITAIDISPAMVARAKGRIDRYPGTGAAGFHSTS